MEKPHLPEENTWLIRWGAEIMGTIILIFGRWILGDIRDTQKEHGQKLIRLEVTLAEYGKTVSEVAHYLHEIKNQIAVKVHVVDELEALKRKVDRISNRTRKKNA